MVCDSEKCKLAELEFSKNRAKFREIIIEKEEELRKEVNAKKELKAQLDDILSQQTVAQLSFEERLECERRKHEEEILSVLHLHKAEHEKELSELYLRLNASLERNNCDNQESSQSFSISPSTCPYLSKTTIELHQEENSDTSGRSAGAGSVLGTVRNMFTNLRLHNTDATYAPNSPASNESHLIRSFVQPLEEELEVLKQKMREMDSQLQVQLNAREKLLQADRDLIGCLKCTETADGLCDKLASASKSLLDNRDLCNKDALINAICVYVSLLEAQKLLLKEDLKYLRSQASDTLAQMQEERGRYQGHQVECKRMSDTLMNLQSQNFKLQRLLKSKRNQSGNSESDHLEHSNTSKIVIANASNNTNEVNDRISFELTHESNLTSSVDQITSSDSELSPTNIPHQQMAGCDLDNLPLVHSSDIADINQSLTIYNPDSQSNLSICGSDITSLQSLNIYPGQRVVSEKEWNSLWDQVSLVKESCVSCEKLECELSTCRRELCSVSRQLECCNQTLARCQSELERESSYRTNLSAEWKQNSDENDALNSKLQHLSNVYETKLGVAEQEFKTYSVNLRDKLRRLKAEYQSLQLEVKCLQAENNQLNSRSRTTSAQLQNEFIDLPANIEELQLLLLRTKEDLIMTKISLESANKRFYQKESLSSDNCKRLEESYISEVSKLKSQLSRMQDIETQLDTEKRQNAICRKQLNMFIQLTSGSQLPDDSMSKTNEGQIAELKARISNLQNDLSTSEMVQKDFVKLSQSLQMELEKIRQSEKEVRWQHVDDVKQCQRCSQPLSRKKLHCLHCGRIFCPDCITKRMRTGPNRREARVCDICYTLLDRESAPYFSTK